MTGVGRPPGRRVIENKHSTDIKAQLYLECKCTYRSADPVHGLDSTSVECVFSMTHLPVPVRRRWAVRRRHTLPRFESAPKHEHSVWQPGLGGLCEPLQG